MGGKGKAKPALEAYSITNDIMKLLIIDNFKNINGWVIVMFEVIVFTKVSSRAENTLPLAPRSY